MSDGWTLWRELCAELQMLGVRRAAVVSDVWFEAGTPPADRNYDCRSYVLVCVQNLAAGDGARTIAEAAAARHPPLEAGRLLVRYVGRRRRHHDRTST